MEAVNIDSNLYKEISRSYLRKLSGDKILNFDIIDQNGAILFQSGTVITTESIELVAEQGKRFFVPKIQEGEGSFEHQIISKERLKVLNEETVKTYSAVRASGTLSYEDYLNTHEHLTELIKGLRPDDKSGGLLTLLKDIKDFDHYTYVHSVNVGILAMILAYKLGYNNEQVRLIAIAGYLHDIGKMRIAVDIINKPGQLSSNEFTAMMEHTRDGYRILDGITDRNGDKAVPNLVKLTALFHHRKFKNKGYPYREFRDKNNEQFFLELPDELRMIAICDMFDALTTSTPYRKAMSVDLALKNILNLSNYYYTFEDVTRFMRLMTMSLNKGQHVFHVGNFVILVTSHVSPEDKNKREFIYEFGRIIELYSGRPLDPRVRVFYNINSNKKIRPIEIDLRYDFSRKIVRVLDSQRMLTMLNKIYA